MGERIDKIGKELSERCSMFFNSSGHTRKGCGGINISRSLPSVGEIELVVRLFRELIFPGHICDKHCVLKDLEGYISDCLGEFKHRLLHQIKSVLACSTNYSECECEISAQSMTDRIIERIPSSQSDLYSDVIALYDGDPAAISLSEIIFCYPGLLAVSSYRLANILSVLGVPLLPRIISELAHSKTGIDIHPRATIGRSFAIDHGTGVVIGATSIIGAHVKIYQGVTLGAKSFPLDDNGNPIKGINRHPIIEDNVVIYSNASVIGRITIGKGAVIGANTFVSYDVEPGGKVLR
ncbi:MAG: serine O-acetyltransferase [Bacteroidales bacterium]